MHFRNIVAFLVFAAINLTTVSVVNADTWRSDLDWDSFAAKLSPTSSVLDTSFSDYVEQCRPLFEEPGPERTAHYLIEQPSGMCVTQYFCAYERCWPRPDAATTANAQQVADHAAWNSLTTIQDLSAETKAWIDDPENPSLNLPSKVLFPVVASDVVEAIKFAGEHGLEISVKNSGHSFIGASTKKDTLHINMMQFTQYSSSSIVDCDDGNQSVLEDMDDQVCSLAEARNKPAYIRVGGGENWDKVYRSVETANAEQGNKYHVVGGAAGTVSPMGWTFQGGLAGTQGGRMYGFGVDQVLQVEMVLPNGEHVRFGPVEWEDASAEGFIVPKTTLVGGVCRSNPEELDESLWEWSECSEALGLNFDDLWFATMGGGGGTWGVVTSIYLQLHEYRTTRIWGIQAQLGADCDPAVKEGLAQTYFVEAFRLTWVMNPSRLNVAQADSDACGSPDGAQFLVCYGDGPYQTLINAWGKFVTDFFDPATYGFSADDALACPGTVESAYTDLFKIPTGPYAGRIPDNPLPNIPTEVGTGGVNVLIPQKFIEESWDTLSESYPTFGAQFYLAFGSGTASASDQANSLGAAHRTAGYKIVFPASDFYSLTFGGVYDISDKTNFPSFQGSNHVGPNNMGPLKDDWTKVCPSEWTQEERNEKCVSIQETIYGTKVLTRLEAIKEAIDPNYMFDCAGCIGNNRNKKPTSVDESEDETEEESEEEIEDESEEVNEDESEDVVSVGSIASIKVTVLLILSVIALFL